MVQLNPKYFPGGQSPVMPGNVNITEYVEDLGGTVDSQPAAPVNTTPVNTTPSAPAEQSLLMRYIEKTGLSPVMPGWTNPSEAEMLAVVEGREFRRTALKEFGNASYMTVYVDDGSRVPGGASFLSAKDIPYFKKGIVDLFYGWYQNPDQIWGTIEQWAGPTNTNADNRKGFMRDLQRYSSGQQQNLLNQWIQGGFGNPPAGLDTDFAIDALDYAFREMGRGQQNKTRGFIDKFTNFVTDPMNWVKAIATAAVMAYVPGGQAATWKELGKSAGAELLKSATRRMAVDGTLNGLRPTQKEINDAIPEDATDNIPVERDEYLERVDYFQDPFTNYRPPIEDPGGTSEEVVAEQVVEEEIIEEPIVEETETNTEIDNAVARIYEDYPELSTVGFEVVDQRGTPVGEEALSNGRKAEFFPVDEPGPPNRPNPHFGTPTVEIYDPTITGESLYELILGDMLHNAPRISEEFDALRERFKATITPEQEAMDRAAYEEMVRRGEEDRPYEQWLEVSRIDAYIRGAIAPDADNEWEGVYTEEQLRLIEEMKATLGNQEVEVDPVPEKEVEIDPVPEAERTAEEVAGDIAVDVATDAVVDAISGGQQAEQQPVSVDPNVEKDAEGNPLQDAAVAIAADAVVDAVQGTETEKLFETMDAQIQAEQNEGAGEVGTEVEVGEGAGDGVGEGEGKGDEEKEKEEEEKLQEEERAANQPVESSPKKVEYEFFEVPGRSVLEFAEAPELGRLDVKPYRRKVTLPEYNRELGALQTNVLAPQLMRYPTSLSDMQALERRRKKFALGRSLLGG